MYPTLVMTLALGQPPTLPEIRILPAAAEPGVLVKLRAETNGKEVKWRAITPGASVIAFPGQYSKEAVFCAPAAGSYKVIAWTAAGDVPTDAAEGVVTVGRKPEDDKKPDPVVPPGPPRPDDKPRPPAEPVARKFYDALYGDALQLAPEQRKKFLAYLAASWATAADLARERKVATAGQLFDGVRESVAKFLKDEGWAANQYQGLRKAIAAQIAAELDFDRDTVLDDLGYERAAAVFGATAKAIEACK